MTTRRSFFAGAAALSLAPKLTWADAGSPNYLSAARLPDDTFRLFGLDRDVQPLFSIPLPARGHAAAAHPERAEAVAFARRPGTFALVLNCVSGELKATLKAPAERHFYGHGVFSRDGSRLFTTENAYQIGEGRIGIWAADDGYRRVGEFPSGGIGPHDVLRLPGTDILAVANGGIDTHPETGREKLNIPSMQPNLSYVTETGEQLDRMELPPEMHKSSIRHLALRHDGLVAFGCQWQGDLLDVPPLLGLHRIGMEPNLLAQAPEAHLKLNGYVGSVAFSNRGDQVAIAAPRGNQLVVFDAASGSHVRTLDETDVCGVASSKSGFVFTAGSGSSGQLSDPKRVARNRLAWDNHLVGIDGA
ncbi:MAG: DUF1513 domain-containing protein [Pseudomonadota bacterium]